MFTPFQTAIISSVQNIQLKEISLYYRPVNFKMFFGSTLSSEKPNESKSTSSKVEFVCSVFLEEMLAWKKHFEFVWPLERTKAETF